MDIVDSIRAYIRQQTCGTMQISVASMLALMVEFDKQDLRIEKTEQQLDEALIYIELRGGKE